MQQSCWYLLQTTFQTWCCTHIGKIYVLFNYSWVRKIWRRDRLPTPVFLGFLCGSAGKESTCNVGELGLIPGLGRSPREGKGYPLQYSGLENSMGSVVLGITKSWTRLSNFDFDFHFFSFTEQVKF